MKKALLCLMLAWFFLQFVEATWSQPARWERVGGFKNKAACEQAVLAAQPGVYSTRGKPHGCYEE